MKKLKIALFAALATTLAGMPHADSGAMLDDSLGLSPVSVFDVPAPAAFDYRNLDPKEAGVLPRAWDDAPPQIPHRVDKYLPVNAKFNKCLECHEEPEKIGKKQKGKPTPMSNAHYVGTGKALSVSNRHYVCTLCHAPQTEAKALMDNTFRGDR